MLIFISGGVRSGKSKLGEDIVVRWAKGRKIYLATAQCYDHEMELRISKHQTDRVGKDFVTLERSNNIGDIIPVLEKEDTVLLDCLGTLLANELFFDPLRILDKTYQEEVSERILADILQIHHAVSHLIVISNEIFSDGIVYDPATECYIEALGSLHIRLAAASDTAIECVCGGQMIHKGG